MCFAPQRRALFRHLNFQKCSETLSFKHFWLRNVRHATTPCTFPTSQLPKVLWDSQFLTHFNSKCASRHNAVHFFNISTSKSAPRPSVFNTFDFEMCVAPLRDPQFLTHFTSKCASRHNGVHFFDISTSKSVPRPSVFNAFYFQMCFAPQRRALFRHLNSKTAPRPSVFNAFYFKICFAPQRRALFQHLNFRKCPETLSF